MSHPLTRGLLCALSCVVMTATDVVAAPPQPAPVKAPSAKRLVAPKTSQGPAAARPGAKPHALALPDGTFVGSLRAEDRRWPLRVTVVAGMVVYAEADRGAGHPPLPLKAAGAPDAPRLRLTGRDGKDYLQLRGAFFDPERGAGRFDGTFQRKRIQGSWVVARR